MLTQGRKPSWNPVLMQLLLLLWLMAVAALLAPQLYSCSCTCFCPLLHFVINQSAAAAALLRQSLLFLLLLALVGIPNLLFSLCDPVSPLM